MAKPHVTIIGAGITGLTVALYARKDYAITIVDAGPDPRKHTHTQGATYSGMDARHISVTETTPWTYEHRHDLIVKNVRDGGWMCIPESQLSRTEQQWINKFQVHTKDREGHELTTQAVIAYNTAGVNEWKSLVANYDFIKPIANSTYMPMLSRSRDVLREEFAFDSSLDENSVLHEGSELPSSLSPLRTHLTELGNIGYYTSYCMAFYSRTLCIKLIEFLEAEGVKFSWSTNVSDEIIEEQEHKLLEDFGDTDAIVWCAGVTPHSSQLLSKYGILIQGVMGCWLSIDNPGVNEACKIYGPEPLNYINITPSGNQLLLSGGYGFVGTRPHSEAKILAQPLMDALIEEVKRWFPDCKITDQAFCIRPSTPSGLPVFATHKTNNNLPVIIAAGHAAGGFTQAPATAGRVLDELQKVLV